MPLNFRSLPEVSTLPQAPFFSPENAPLNFRSPPGFNWVPIGLQFDPSGPHWALWGPIGSLA